MKRRKRKLMSEEKKSIIGILIEEYGIKYLLNDPAPNADQLSPELLYMS